MSASVRNPEELLRSMQPMLNPGVYVFACISPSTDLRAINAIATFRETEGLTVIVEEQQALNAGLTALFRCAWLTLAVHSDLRAVGLTAAVATALTQADISCNVVAAAFHDHLFVPIEAAARALKVLEALQTRYR